MKLHHHLLCFLLCLPFLVSGQPTQRARAEIGLSSDFHNLFVYPQPDSTVLVLKLERQFRRNAEPFAILKFNHDLNLAWQEPIELARGSQVLSGTTQQKICYLLFEGIKRDEYFLVRIDSRTGEQAITRHLLPENMSFRINNLQVLDGYLFLNGLEDGRLVVLHLDPDAQDMLKIPAIYDQSTALTEFLVDTTGQRVEFILAESNGLKGRLQIKRLAPDGRLFSLNFLQHHDFNYLSGRLSPGDSTTKLIAGIYSLRDLRYAQGFFAGPFLSNGTEQLKYYDFTTFSHYFDYLRPGRQEKLRRKVARFKVTRKFFQLRQRMLGHRLYPFGNGYLLVGEMYFPKYENEGAHKGTFDGYQFTEAVIAAIDKQGNLLWENSLPIQNRSSFELLETVTVGVSGNRTILCYPEDEKIWYKEITGSETTPNDKYITIVPALPSEKASSTYPDKIENWYRNNLLTYGVQNVRGPNGFRTVFYLTKIAF